MVRKLLSVLLTLLLIISAVPLGAFTFTVNAADDYNEGYYTYTVENNKATITGVDSSISGDITIPSTLGGYLVTSIGGCAFLDCASLTGVTIPDSVTSIGDEAFEYCTSLKSVTIPDSVTSIGDYAFWGCESLENVYITDIAAWCNIDFDSGFSNPLYYANNLYLNGELLTDVVIPDGVTRIPEWAFSCTSLTSITIPHSVTSIDDYAFDTCDNLTSITIPDSVTSIGYGAFYYCDNLTSISIPDSVTSIGDWAFYKCTSLTSITIPDSVTSIGYGTFSSCESLTIVTIGNSVSSIGDWAFDDCNSLTSITFPDSVSSIGDYVFSGCTSLTEIIVSENNEYYCSVDGVLFDKEVKVLTQYPLGKTDALYVIPSGVTGIGDKAFYWCTSLTNVTIPDSVTSIGDRAFYWCTSLTDVWYKGNESDKTNISIGGSNDELISATWHYNSCIGSETHTYDDENDAICNICGALREGAHIWSDWVEQSNGIYYRECIDCGDTETLIIPEDKPINTTPNDNAADTNLGNNDIELLEKVLNDQEQSDVANGAELSVYLVVNDITESVTGEDKSAVETTVPDSKVGMYLDIDLFKKIDTNETQVTKTNSNVTITITVPDELINTDISIVRTYKIVRIHNGVSDVIEGIFNPDNNTFTFETDKFSTYALTYADDMVASGDANGDGEINSRDAALVMQYINGWDVVIDITAAADVNNDKKINSKDYVLLVRYINGWNVELQ